MEVYDLIIVGGGASGILCAINAKNEGIDNVLLIEKDPILGGRLNNCSYCIDKENKIIGEEYKKSIIEKFETLNVDLLLNTMVLKIENECEVVCLNGDNGIHRIKGSKIILTNGAKEKGRNTVNIPGDRCAGILNVTMAEKIFNMKNIIPGKNILIYGDYRLNRIAENIKNHNIKVAGIVGKDSFGLTDNLLEGYELIEIKGNGRVEGAVLRQDNNVITLECDTIIFAQKMISDGIVAMRSGIVLNPETTGPKVNDKFMTSNENVFACGDGIHINETIEDIEDQCKKVIKFI